MSSFLHELTEAVEEGIPSLFASVMWQSLNDPTFRDMRMQMHRMDLEQHRRDINDNSAPCHKEYGHCFKCLMKEEDMKERRRTVKKLFDDPRFWNGPDSEWQSNQLLTTYDIHNLLFNRETQEIYGVKSVKEFREFLLDLNVIPLFIHLLKLTKPSGDVHNPEWYCVGYYTMSILGALVTPDDLMVLHDRTNKERKKYEKLANKICETDDVVKTLLGFMKGSREVIEMIRSVFILRSFSKLSDRVCEQIVKLDGIRVLVDLFSPGNFQKKAALLRDKGYPRYVKVTLSLGIKGWFENANPFYITDDECYQRTVKRAAGVQENSGAVLADIACVNKSNAILVFDNVSCVNAMLKWIKHPILIDDFDQNISTSAAQILRVFLGHKELATCLVEEKDLLTILERVLYLPYSWPLDDYADCIRCLVELGRPFTERVARNKRIIFAMGCYIHTSATKLLQDSASCVVAILSRTQPEILNYLHKKGIVNTLTMAKFEIDDAWERDIKIPMSQIISMAKRYLGKQWLIPSVSSFLPNYKKDWQCSLMKERGNKYFKEENYDEAIRLYSAGLIIAHPSNEAPILYSNRAECYLRLNRNLDAVRDCTLSICSTFEESPVYIKTLFRRAKAFHSLDRPFEALGDIAVCKRENPQEPKFKDLYEEVLKVYRTLKGVVYKVRTCAECMLEGEGMKKCARCSTYFCSPICQKRAWPTHKVYCRAVKGKDRRKSSDDVEKKKSTSKRKGKK